MARTGTYRKWLSEEDSYCVERFISNYFEKLIKLGQPLSSAEMKLEVNLYNQRYNNKRTNDSVKLKFHNIEHLAFKWVSENDNPYNIKILERLHGKSKQSLKAWSNQIDLNTEKLNRWLKK